MKALLFTACLLWFNIAGYCQDEFYINADKNKITIRAGIVQKVLSIDQFSVNTENISLNNQIISDPESNELSMSIYYASSNKAPEGIIDTVNNNISQTAQKENATDILEVSKSNAEVIQNASWIKIADLQANKWTNAFDHVNCAVSEPDNTIKRLNLRVRAIEKEQLANVSINIFYEIYQGHSAIRKWVEICNNSPKWLKVDNLNLDNFIISEKYRNITELTPSERGATSSIISFGNSDHSAGVIIGSEVPSALRFINNDGKTGYAPEHFEWVIGPAEKFVSEPVFLYAYSGDNVKTVSAISTSLDRTVEGTYKKFLYTIVGLKKTTLKAFVPQWCTWSNFGAFISHDNICQMADIASEAGFKCLLLDAGWAQSESPGAWATSSTIPDKNKFPDFSQTASYIKEKGMKLGLWVSCYRNPRLAADFKSIQNGFSIPLIKRDGGLAMSFASQWRHYYANDISFLHDKYGASYFKQDLTNIKFGDIAKGHESRTQKESLLRGLRSLLATMDEISHTSPAVLMDITHEIYWGTPGVPCDLAALKHVYAYHIPPNDYSGAGNPGQRYSLNWNYQPDSMKAKLIEGCFNARKELYKHRGLPLQSIEYYGAATLNYKGSLTPDVQKRQVCSWLMGVPAVFSGDLASLTEENIRVYRTCFDLLENLNNKYSIYQNFQFSGVPAPTDTDWHWWGKLNEKGEGAVVVLRGSKGENSRKINIPWVLPDKTYKLRLCFDKTNKGSYKGKDLINGALSLALSTYSQEIIEISEN
ncbi:alpha-galactosidase [Dyadobacter sediminis]|uniref:Alpha-galactosidase n=1 Tax=Dyadobacter sediminis TaxID=1493691 RepID=A0A5R9K7H9_9BACT|nr:alpha-galactosidase [Dyadobacter sediminis]TLU89817.1 hypothetical protein FEM55_19980 [Dyadobacter sediminis]GGC12564.1 hypothetical protein GCM10011325_44280 [Dyadobacter sediminis]